MDSVTLQYPIDYTPELHRALLAMQARFIERLGSDPAPEDLMMIEETKTLLSKVEACG